MYQMEQVCRQSSDTINLRNATLLVGIRILSHLPFFLIFLGIFFYELK